MSRLDMGCVGRVTILKEQPTVLARAVPRCCEPQTRNGYDVRDVARDVTWEKMYERIGTVLDEITHMHKGGTIVVVTSGGPLRASYVTLRRASCRDGIIHTRETKNTSITEWASRQSSVDAGATQ